MIAAALVATALAFVGYRVYRNRHTPPPPLPTWSEDTDPSYFMDDEKERSGYLMNVNMHKH